MREACLQFPSARSTASSCVTVCPRQGTVCPRLLLELVLSPAPCLSLSGALFSLGSPPASWALLGPPPPTLTKHWVGGCSSSLLSLHSCLLSRGHLIHSGLWKRISSPYLSPRLWTWYLPSFAISRSVGLNQPRSPTGLGLPLWASLWPHHPSPRCDSAASFPNLPQLLPQPGPSSPLASSYCICFLSALHCHLLVSLTSLLPPHWYSTAPVVHEFVAHPPAARPTFPQCGSPPLPPSSTGSWRRSWGVSLAAGPSLRASCDLASPPPGSSGPRY